MLAVNYLSYNMYCEQQYRECTKWVANFNTPSLIDKLYFVNLIFLLNCCTYYIYVIIIENLYKPYFIVMTIK